MSQTVQTPRNLPEALAAEIERIVDLLIDEYAPLINMRGVMIGPAIALIKQEIKIGLTALASGDVEQQILAYKMLQERKE